MMIARKTSSFSAQIVLTILISTFVMAGIVAVVGYAAIEEVDSDAVQREIGFATHGLEAEIARLTEEQKVSTLWDEAVIEVRADNQDWMERNLGVWMQTYYGHDAVYVVRPDDTLLYAALDEKTVRLRPGTRLPAPLAALVQTLRDRMAAANPDPADSTAAIADLDVVETIPLDGGVSVVSVAPIVPTTTRLPQPPGTEFIHISLQNVDTAMAIRIAEPHGLRRASFRTTPPAGGHEIGVPIRDSAGKQLAWLTWTADRPGLRLMHEMIPALALAALFGLGLLVWLLRRLWVSSQQLHRSEAEARFLANHDLLAGLPNRMHFEENLAHALASERQGGPSVTLLSIDLDRFKPVNDTLGHAAGDELIRQVAARLSAQIRSTDTVARLGGDEFGVILLGMAGEETLTAFCAGLLHVLSKPYDLAAGQAHVGASIGVAIAAQIRGGMETVMRCADAALYRAKNDGRGRFRLFTEEMDDVLRQRHEIERDLRAALRADDQLEVVFQPIYDASGALVGAEALTRWPRAPHGAVSPDVFIGVAEECGLIHALGAWVLETACRAAVRTGLPKLAVNVSPIQLRGEGFAAEVLRILSDTGLAPQRLELELTEHFHLDPGQNTRRNLHDLRMAGISIALDDFATGQSLLQYVRDYEIDMIKIDRSFVGRLGQGDGTDEVVRAMLDLGRAMGLEVTAEGVETAHQREILLSMGCRIFQGFLLGRPMDGNRLASLTDDRSGQPLTA
ncbi:periplasmic sensor diguanylate cyclase/phosphodiesterase [Cereibacter ovatus]|uniref:Periplasmic sensor diguanylate cyclase/phosphodiesterase n=1 Tax=Cereibacter ovatus TaxID=439529 RepID=A0A285CVA0_9RHOB|nr:EAL domain-containing protein [Cereibacter ovatus]SNX71345.1 periplasmic sensor diguanylate cyclase/phosphodiesterase [Cereibacter ovatus]